MIRRLAVLVLLLTVAGTLAVAVPTASTAGRPMLPRVSCEPTMTNSLTEDLSRQMARKFNRRGWQVLERLEYRTRALAEAREENRVSRAIILDQQAQIEALEAQLAEQEAEPTP